MAEEELFDGRGTGGCEAEAVFFVAFQEPADGVIAEAAFAIEDDEQTVAQQMVLRPGVIGAIKAGLNKGRQSGIP